MTLAYTLQWLLTVLGIQTEDLEIDHRALKGLTLPPSLDFPLFSATVATAVLAEVLGLTVLPSSLSPSHMLFLEWMPFPPPLSSVNAHPLFMPKGHVHRIRGRIIRP